MVSHGHNQHNPDYGRLSNKGHAFLNKNSKEKEKERKANLNILRDLIDILANHSFFGP